jgi:hypothetical protein
MFSLILSIGSLVVATSSSEKIIIPSNNFHGHTKENVSWLHIKESKSSNLDTIVAEDTSVVSGVMLATGLVMMRVVGSGPRTSTFASEGTILIVIDSSPRILIVANPLDSVINSKISEPNSPRSRIGGSRMEAMGA